jgi:hypothetical protein
MKRPRSRSDPGKHGLPYQLRELIEARGLSAYALAKLTLTSPCKEPANVQ